MPIAILSHGAKLATKSKTTIRLMNTSMRGSMRAILAALVLLPLSSSAQVTDTRWDFLYEEDCGTCHGSTTKVERAASRSALAKLSPERVLAALTTGPMAVNAKGWSDEQKRGMAEFVTGRPLGNPAKRLAESMPNQCQADMPKWNPKKGAHWSGMSPDPTDSARFQTTADAGLTAKQVPKLRMKWVFGFPDGAAVRGQPTVLGGRVFIGSDNGVVYALDAKTGCVHWSYEAGQAVVTAVSVGPVPGSKGRYAVYFGDFRTNVYAVDAEAGKLLWKVGPVEDHDMAKLTGSPVLDTKGGRLFVPVSSWEEVAGLYNLAHECCTSQGSVVALDAATGKQIWKTYTIPERPKPFRKNSAGTQLYGPSGAGVWASPTLDYKRGVLYVGTANGYINVPDAGSSDAVIAFDLDTGERRWSTQLLAGDMNCSGSALDRSPAEKRVDCAGMLEPSNDDVSGSVLLQTLPDGRQVLIAGQESGRITALDPDKEGAVLWVAQAGDKLATVLHSDVRAAGAGMGAATDGKLYFRPLAVTETTGAMAALDPKTGERVWYTAHPPPASCDAAEQMWCSSGMFGAATAIPGVVFAGTREGIMHAYSTETGEILWEFATMREFDTVNGLKARGGSLGGHGPAIVDGMLFFGSGYNILTARTGNVLLAFGID